MDRTRPAAELARSPTGTRSERSASIEPPSPGRGAGPAAPESAPGGGRSARQRRRDTSCRGQGADRALAQRVAGALRAPLVEPAPRPAVAVDPAPPHGGRTEADRGADVGADRRPQDPPARAPRRPAVTRGHLLLGLVVAVVLVAAVSSWLVGHDDGKLTWAPPRLSDPVTYRVSGEGPGTLEAEPGQDSIVVFDGPVHRRIIMKGGRHWVIRGGEIDNDRTWSDWNDQSGLQFDGVQGTAFVEGVHIHGRKGTDGIRVRNGDETTLVVQNSRIVDRVSHDGFHADVIQPFGGVEALKVDRLTGAGDYQGQMWKQEPGTYFGPTDFRRVNFRKTAESEQSMFNFVTHSPTQPVTLTEVYHEPYGDIDFCRAHYPSAAATCATDDAGREYVTFPDISIEVDGRITSGPPPGGDFVPPDVVGLDYVSPGYR